MIDVVMSVETGDVLRPDPRELRDMSKRRASTPGAASAQPNVEAASGLFKAALRQHQAGSFEDAELLYRNVIAQNPNHAPALSNLGVLARQKKRTKEAIAYYQRSLRVDPNVASTHHNLGNALLDGGRLEDAKREFATALRLKPDYVEARLSLAGVLVTLGEPEEALRELNAQLTRTPNHVGVLATIARLLMKRSDHAGATQYLLRAVELDPRHAEALNNLGCICSDAGKKHEAKGYFERAVRAAPNLAPSHLNLGNMLRDLEGPQAGVPHFKRATELDPKYAKAWFNLGSALTRIDRKESLRCLREVIAIAPDHVGALICCLMEAEKTADFLEADRLYDRLVTALRAQVGTYADWNVLGNVLYNSIFRPLPADLQRLVEERIDRLLRELTRKQGPLPTQPADVRGANERLRIGFISPNFRDHPVGHVTLSFFAALDRSRFEVHGFSTQLGAPEQNEYVERHRSGFDAWHTIGRLSPRAAAAAIREQRIDVLVDLDGYMDNTSPPILAYRPAPVQAFWLGHAGGLGLSCVDYLIADSTVVPEEEDSRYRERILRLPRVYHCADRATIAEAYPSREELGLPAHGFVFCAFNNPQKIDAQAFDCWMRILSRVEGSCLWLSDPRHDEEMTGQLRKRAESLGIAPERIVFATRIADKAVHLARHGHAGLFLDTFTLNASTTALDALWAGVPLVTMAGSRFASRIATTFLRSFGLQELVTPDFAGYETLAVELAQNGERLRSIRDRLCEMRAAAPSFDIERFARDFETAVDTMWRRLVSERNPEAKSLAQFEDFPEVEAARAAERPSVHAEPASEGGERRSAPSVTAEVGSVRRLHIGGREPKPGWHILNVQPGPHVDFVGNCVDLSMFPDGSVEEIYASHVFEHLGFRTELPRALREVQRILTPSGRLRISVPDLEALSRLLVSPEVPKNQRFSLMMHLFGAQEDPYDQHRVGFTEEILGMFLKRAGFVRMKRVSEFGLFDDFSSYRRFGVLISLNVEAYKQ
jgi:predicted O-linked N-acetylglucosamine transferase (SPINDLY family)/predicted SAM-dependent methyltransferase